MTWRKALTVLASRNKIDSAAIFDLDGNILARTENFAEKQRDVDAVLHVLRSTNHQKLIKLSVFGDVFTCVCPGHAGFLLANSEDRLFVAAKTQKCVVIAFSNEEASGSCLYNVTEFCKLLKRKGLEC